VQAAKARANAMMARAILKPRRAAPERAPISSLAQVWPVWSAGLASHRRVSGRIVIEICCRFASGAKDTKGLAD
jgi:hypothetical protein